MIFYPLPNNNEVIVYLNETGLGKTPCFYLRLCFGNLRFIVSNDNAPSFWIFYFPSFLDGDSWGLVEFRFNIFSLSFDFNWNFFLD